MRKYADSKHRHQAEAIILAFGNFVIEFEKVCELMRYIIMFTLRSQGLQHQGMEQVVIGGKASGELQILLGALYSELRDQDTDDKKEVKKLLKDIKTLTEHRNIFLHNTWNLGAKASENELLAATLTFKTKQHKGASVKAQGFTASYIDEWSMEAKRLQELLNRLMSCVCQPELKVSTEFNKPS